MECKRERGRRRVGHGVLKKTKSVAWRALEPQLQLGVSHGEEFSEAGEE
jgi:hypothetical protein